MTIRDLLEVTTIRTVNIFTSTNVRGKDNMVEIGTFNVIRDAKGHYMSMEEKQGIDVHDFDGIIHCEICDTSEVCIEI